MNRSMNFFNIFYIDSLQHYFLFFTSSILLRVRNIIECASTSLRIMLLLDFCGTTLAGWGAEEGGRRELSSSNPPTDSLD